MFFLEADHSRRAQRELVIKYLEGGPRWNMVPSGYFVANAIWRALGAIPRNLALLTARIGQITEFVGTTPKLRQRYFQIAGHITRSAPGVTLHFEKHWPNKAKVPVALKLLQRFEVNLI